MPDPHKDLADIIEPQIANVTGSDSDWALIGGTIMLGLAIVGFLYWHWRRGAPRRALQRLRGLPDPQRAADALASLLPHFKTQPEQAWLDELARLRFGPPQEKARAILDALCQQAEALLRQQGHR